MSTTQFQIGTRAQPITVKWPTSHYDEGKPTRALKCFVDDEKLIEELKDIDGSLVNDDNILRLKLWQTADVQLQSSGELLTVDQLRQGDRIAVIAKPYKWKFEGRQGTSLTASHVIVVERASSERQSTDWL